jgi:hypothetical protein
MKEQRKGAALSQKHVVIPPPNMQVAEFTIIGTSPYVQHKFGAKAKAELKAQQEAGSKGRKGKKKEPKDFKLMYEEAQHKLPDGSWGISAAGLRTACIDACRLCGFKMTVAKMSVFFEEDGFDVDDATPLIRITKGKPSYFESHVRLATGTIDLHARPMWAPGWEAKVRVRFDADQFSLEDVANLLSRVGAQVGIGEGRPYSKNSAGQGWGLFRIADKKEGKKKR